MLLEVQQRKCPMYILSKRNPSSQKRQKTEICRVGHWYCYILSDHGRYKVTMNMNRCVFFNPDFQQNVNFDLELRMAGMLLLISMTSWGTWMTQSMVWNFTLLTKAKLIVADVTGILLNFSKMHMLCVYFKIVNNKLGCILPMVVVMVLPHAEIGQNDHREDASHFIIILPFDLTL